MVSTTPTRNHSFPGHALGIIVITLAVALAAFAAYAAVSIGTSFAVRAAAGQPMGVPLSVMTKLYGWASVGTTVVIQ